MSVSKEIIRSNLYLPKLSGEASPPALFIQSDSLTSAECRGFAPRIFEKTLQFPVKSIHQTSLSLADILEPDEQVDKKYFASEYILQKRQEGVKHKKLFFPSIWHENKGGNIGVNNFSCALRSGASFNYLLVNGVRRLTPREQLRLQGFPEDFKIEGSETKIRKQTGNSVSVPVVAAIAAEMVKAMRSPLSLSGLVYATAPQFAMGV